jgi:serine/threonine protein kinase
VYLFSLNLGAIPTLISTASAFLSSHLHVLVVWKAINLQTGHAVAIKRMKTVFRSIDQVNGLREIQALRRVSSHQNVIKLLEILYDRQTGRLSLVFELMICNLYEFVFSSMVHHLLILWLDLRNRLVKGRDRYLPEIKVKTDVYHVLRALDFMHNNGIFHRDIKPENILIVDDLAKVADLGSCRGIYTAQPFSEYISTRWSASNTPFISHPLSISSPGSALSSGIVPLNAFSQMDITTSKWTFGELGAFCSRSS